MANKVLVNNIPSGRYCGDCSFLCSGVLNDTGYYCSLFQTVIESTLDSSAGCYDPLRDENCKAKMKAGGEVTIKVKKA